MLWQLQKAFKNIGNMLTSNFVHNLETLPLMKGPIAKL